MVAVGTGTIARHHNRVMNSNDEELKKKVLADKINTANKKSKDIADSNRRRSSNVLQMEKSENESRSKSHGNQYTELSSSNGDHAKIKTDKEQAKSTQGTRTDLESSPNGEQSKLKTHTDKELSKMAGIGTGSVARFNKLMNSDDEEFKKKIRNKQKKICP